MTDEVHEASAALNSKHTLRVISDGSCLAVTDHYYLPDISQHLPLYYVYIIAVDCPKRWKLKEIKGKVVSCVIVHIKY